MSYVSVGVATGRHIIGCFRILARPCRVTNVRCRGCQPIVREVRMLDEAGPIVRGVSERAAVGEAARCIRWHANGSQQPRELYTFPVRGRLRLWFRCSP